jgi:hypothetical protein
MAKAKTMAKAEAMAKAKAKYIRLYSKDTRSKITR